MRFRRALLLVPFLLAVAVSHAELKWDKPSQEFKCSSTDASLETHFTFQNAGQTVVTIKSLRTSCGCTTARLEKKTYAPGEKGDILARFVFGNRNGSYHLTVTVATDQKGSAPQTLEMAVDVHDPVAISQELVFWKTGEAPEAKTVQLTADAGLPVHVKSVTSSNPRVTVAFETVKDGAEYRISVKPLDTAKKESANIIVQTDYPANSPRTCMIYARIK